MIKIFVNLRQLLTKTNIMKKLLFGCALALFAFTSASAQSSGSGTDRAGFKVGAGLNVLFPVSNGELYSVGAGVDLLGQYYVSENVAITADLGYTSLMVKSKYKDIGFKSSYGIIPIRAGVRFFPSEQFYLGGKVGVGIGTGEGSTTLTAYSFGAGYMLSSKLDIGLNYDGYSKNGSMGWLGLRLGYTFN